MTSIYTVEVVSYDPQGWCPTTIANEQHTTEAAAWDYARTETKRTPGKSKALVYEIDSYGTRRFLDAVSNDNSN